MNKEDDDDSLYEIPALTEGKAEVSMAGSIYMEDICPEVFRLATMESGSRELIDERRRLGLFLVKPSPAEPTGCFARFLRRLVCKR